VEKADRQVTISNNEAFRKLNMDQKEPVPLSSVEKGKKVRLVSVEAGQSLKGRLTAMGLLPNVEIVVLNNEAPGPFVIRVKDSKMVVGRGMAHKILVV